MSPETNLVLAVVVGLIVFLVLLLLFREVNCWYWKINQMVDLLTRIESTLRTGTPPIVPLVQPPQQGSSSPAPPLSTQPASAPNIAVQSNVTASPRPAAPLEDGSSVRSELCPHCNQPSWKTDRICPGCHRSKQG